MKILFVNIYLILVLFSCASVPDIIYYQDDIKLNKRHFRVQFDKIDSTVLSNSGNNACAYVMVDISTNGKYGLDSGQADIRAFMNTKKSWLKEEYRNNHRVLQHELYHFKISELYARQLRQILLSEELTLKKLVELIEEIRADCSWYQNQYDEETSHSNSLELSLIHI